MTAVVREVRIRVMIAALVCFLASLLVFTALSCSSDGLQRTVASTYVEGTSGTIGGEDTRDLTTATVGFRPLAAFEPPTQVRWADERPSPPPGPEDHGLWWEDDKFLAWVEGIFTLLAGVLIAVVGKKGYDHIKRKKENDDLAGI